MDEEVVMALPWAWHDDNVVWCGKASTMDMDGKEKDLTDGRFRLNDNDLVNWL